MDPRNRSKWPLLVSILRTVEIVNAPFTVIEFQTPILSEAQVSMLNLATHFFLSLARSSDHSGNAPVLQPFLSSKTYTVQSVYHVRKTSFFLRLCASASVNCLHQPYPGGGALSHCRHRIALGLDTKALSRTSHMMAYTAAPSVLGLRLSCPHLATGNSRY